MDLVKVFVSAVVACAVVVGIATAIAALLLHGCGVSLN